MRLFLSALLVLAPALPVAAQVRVVTPSVSNLVSAPAATAPIAVSAPIAPTGISPVCLLPAGVALPAAPVPVAAAAAPMPAVQAFPAAPAAADSKPAALHSLRDLGLLAAGSDGASAVADAFDGKPRVLPGMPGVAVKSSRGRLSEFQPHELATIRKIQRLASDLHILVRESGPTPDLLVNGVVTELKSAHKGRIVQQLEHANGQLLSHAKRHGLGLGAVVLDVVGEPMTTSQVEDGIAQVLREQPEIGFARVYVFHGDEVRTYSRGADGAFRLDASAEPFARLPQP